ncbi:MAG: carboxymuconolactone decarboxylase family protein [Bryobacteraceae bacterium]|nr:carboxymuconolactone decarboxylase family protein [Bryobacteraceae bacterium]
MTLEQLYDRIPEYAKDQRLNLQNVLKQTELSEQQTWGTVIACAIAVRLKPLADILIAEAAKIATPETQNAAKAAASVMGMNNIYYRFTHMVTSEKYATIPARLRMNAIRTHGGDPVDFELYCTAVSAINNCQACVGAHEKVLREKGVSEETILAAVRIAAVIHAIASVLDYEGVAAA